MSTVLKQKVIEGTQDVVPEEVSAAADEYLRHKRAVAKSREKMNAAIDRLIGKMKEHDVAEMLIDDGEKRLILDSKELIKIKARKKDDDGSESEGE